jgi:hypothetical protein
MKNFLRPIFAVTFAALLLAAVSIPSTAAQRAASHKANTAFDGLWSVSIVTLQGDCDRAYRYPVRIAGSRVVQADSDPSYQLYGAVAHSGAIRVIVARNGQWADGRGRLSSGRGQGQWHTSTGQCAGEWTAVRRG